ncbi:MAG: protease modulator HflC [Zetaproteobacteria bacterium]|nr:protease modulator HflC [Zetaproteobacteria bacterium]
MRTVLYFLGFLALLVLLNMSTFTVPEHQQAIILELGKVYGDPVTKAGLHWKKPLIQDVKYFDKRILQWDGSRGEIPTEDKKFIWVDTTARWRISNALHFYRAVRYIENALFRMGPIIDGATKDTVSSFSLIESVRNSNAIFEDIKDHRKGNAHSVEGDVMDTLPDEFSRDVREVSYGREKLSEMIADRARAKLVDLGIELIDVQLRSIGYQESVESKVFQSMIAERQQIATKIRSIGKGEEAKIYGQLDLQLKKIESQAFRQAQNIRGEADAQATQIYADAFGQDPEFYSFQKNLDVYRQTLGEKGRLVLSTDNHFFKLLHGGS